MHTSSHSLPSTSLSTTTLLPNILRNSSFSGSDTGCCALLTTRYASFRGTGTTGNSFTSGFFCASHSCRTRRCTFRLAIRLSKLFSSSLTAGDGFNGGFFRVSDSCRSRRCTLPLPNILRNSSFSGSDTGCCARFAARYAGFCGTGTAGDGLTGRFFCVGDGGRTGRCTFRLADILRNSSFSGSDTGCCARFAARYACLCGTGTAGDGLTGRFFCVGDGGCCFGGNG